jgi:hypothetical protein
VNTKSPYIPTLFGDGNTGEVNKAYRNSARRPQPTALRIRPIGLGVSYVDGCSRRRSSVQIALDGGEVALGVGQALDVAYVDA